MATIWFVDTETGGFDCNVHSILSVGLVKWVGGEIKFEEEWLIQENPLIVTGGAMEVNQLDLRIPGGWWTPEKAAYEILREIPPPASDDPEDLPIIGGHNTPFDIGFLKRLFRLGRQKYPFSHRYEDTLPTARFLKRVGLIPADCATGLDGLSAHFGIENKQRHGALGDALATAHLYTAMMEMVVRNSR